MLGLSGDESILAAQAAGSSFPGAGSWVRRAFGHSMFTWVQNDPGSVGPWRRWALKVHGEHKALGALSLLHYYQQLCCGESESAGPRFHVASHKFAAVFGFGNVSRAKSSFPSRCLKVLLLSVWWHAAPDQRPPLFSSPFISKKFASRSQAGTGSVELAQSHPLSSFFLEIVYHEISASQKYSPFGMQKGFRVGEHQPQTLAPCQSARISSEMFNQADAIKLPASCPADRCLYTAGGLHKGPRYKTGTLMMWPPKTLPAQFPTIHSSDNPTNVHKERIWCPLFAGASE